MTNSEAKYQPQHFDLTPSQHQVLQYLVQEIENSQETHTLFILEGLSGIGKSFILENLQRSQMQNLVLVLTSEEAIHYRQGRHNTNARALATTVTLGDTYCQRENVERPIVREIPDVQIQPVIVPAMNREEIVNYVSLLPHHGVLTAQEIIDYSMGVPLLAQQFSGPDITKDLAAQIAAQYLKASFRFTGPRELLKKAEPYLQMPVPRTVMEKFQEVAYDTKPTSAYGDLYLVLAKQHELASEGIEQESPLFVAPQSEEIYTTMLKNRGRAGITIFAPQLTPEQLRRTHYAFGVDTLGRYNMARPIRMEMFSADFRKVSLWHRDIYGERYDKNEWDKIENIPQTYERNYMQGQIPGMKPTSDTARFLVHAHDHYDMITNPFRVGWATESLLQQMGVSYVAQNDTYGHDYVYDAASQQVYILTEKLNFRE